MELRLIPSPSTHSEDHHAHPRVQQHAQRDLVARQHRNDAVDAQPDDDGAPSLSPDELVADDRQQVDGAHGTADQVERHLEENPLRVRRARHTHLQRDRYEACRKGRRDDGRRKLPFRSCCETHGDDVSEDGHQRNVEIGRVHVLARGQERVRPVLIHLGDALPRLGAEGEQEQLRVRQMRISATLSLATTYRLLTLKYFLKLFHKPVASGVYASIRLFIMFVVWLNAISKTAFLVRHEASTHRTLYSRKEYLGRKRKKEMARLADRAADRAVGRGFVAADSSLVTTRKAAMLRVASFAETDSRLQSVNPTSAFRSTWCTHRG